MIITITCNSFFFQLQQGTLEYSLPALGGASIVLVVNGKCTATTSTESLDLHKGCVVFISAEETVKVTEVQENISMFRAFCAL